MCWRNRNEPSLMRGSPAPNRPSKPSVSCSLSDLLLDLLPLDAEGRIGEQVVELVRVRCPSCVKLLPNTMFVGVLALDQHVALQIGVGLGVEFLAEDLQLGVGVQLAQVLLGHGEHAARPAGRVVERADDALLSAVSSSSVNSRLTISRMTSRGVKCSPAVSLDSFGERPDQLLEDRTHVVVRHPIRGAGRRRRDAAG